MMIMPTPRPEVRKTSCNIAIQEGPNAVRRTGDFAPPNSSHRNPFRLLSSKILALALVGWLIASSVCTASVSSVTLAWDASSDPSVSGYYVHYGLSSGTYTNTLDVGSATSATVPNLTVGSTYFF